MKRYWRGIIPATTLALTLGLASCGGNNGDLPAEDNYKNTTESAPETTDNMTGYGDITDSTATDTSGAATTGTTAGGTTSGTTSGSTNTGTTAGGATTGE